MATDIVATVGVDVVPVLAQFHEKLKAGVIPAADRVGADAGRALGDRLAEVLRERVAGSLSNAIQTAGTKAKTTASREGDQVGGAFARSLKAKLEAAFRAMPKLDVKLSDTGTDAELARLRAKLEQLSGKRIGIDVSVADAAAKVGELDAQLRRLGASHPNPAVRIDTATARAALAEIQAEIAAVSRQPWEIELQPGSFRRKLIAQVEAAKAALPVIDVTANTTEASAQLDSLRRELARIPERLETEAGFDDARALARIAELRAKLEELNARGVSIDVRADAASAAAELAAVEAAAKALDRERVNLKVDVSEASSAVLMLGIQIAALAAIPAIPILAAGVGGVAAAFVAASAGAGALGLAAIPAVRGVATALQAQTAAQDQSTHATTAGANAAVTAQQRALSLAGAEASLASARRNASRQVEAASRSLVDAQRAEVQAQDDLTAARRTAEQQLAAYEDRLRDGALSEQDAQLRVLETQQALQAAYATGSTATELQRRRAQLDYDRAVQGAKEASQAQRDLTAGAKAARDAGVEGSTVVRQAQDKLMQSQQKTADAAKAVAEAQTSAAESIASAQRGLRQAMLSTEKSTASAATAADKYEAALAKLSPPARALFDAIAGPSGLKRAFTDWSTSLQPQVLPLFVRGINAAKGSLPGFTPLVLDAADAVGTLFDKAGRELKTPFWRQFKADIDASAGPALLGLGVTFGNVLKGMAGVVDAFLPHMAGISATMERITGRFANWGSGLRGSPEFEHFLDYAERSGPQLASTFGKIADAVLDIGQALSPLSGPVLELVGLAADGISWIAEHAPEAVIAIYAMALAFNTAKIALVAYNFVIGIYQAIVAIATAETISWDVAIQATGIVPLIEIIVVAIIALVAAVIYAYNHWNWFHVAVVATWDAIKTAALFVWNYALKPTFDAIWIGLQYIGKAAMWLWENALGPAFEFIWLAARVLFAILVVAVLTPIWIGIQALGEIAMWLWTNRIQPAFSAIGDAGVWLWNNALKPAFDFMVDAFKGLMVIAALLWEYAIKPAFNQIGDKAGWLWDKALKPAFERTKDALTPLADAFRLAKDLIAEAWGQLYDITKKPVNFLIEWVYTKGIKSVWDRVADFVDLPHLPDGPKLLAAGGTIGAGWGPAVPMVTNRPTAIVGEGNPAYPEYVIPTDPRYRSRAIALHAAAGSQLLASGGIIGDVWSGITGAAGAAWSAAKDGAEMLKNPGAAWEKLTKPIRDMIAKIGESQMAKTVAGIPVKAVSGLKDKLLSVVGLGGGSGSGNGGAGVQQWAPAVRQALAMLGQPESWMDTVLRRMNQESGGNPTVVNTWDSNWAAGTPSVGLMQVIGPTFRAYADAFRNTGPFLYGTSTDPLANIFAGLNYALHTYGSLSALNRPGGYDAGGYLPTGTSLVYNHTGKPEPVFTTGQWDAIQRAGTTGGGDVAEIHVYVGDREITDIVRTEVRYAETATARDLLAGVK
ncbi:transglycosylase SLT domain-containing protein [Kitasatospora sp. NPDC059646]|uniref:transglycosylase SLT domain-containing protein n=1 Tax=Kitasatospora sp. NPDC059646 TaxID=3346893 RepID=UPI0036BA3786